MDEFLKNDNIINAKVGALSDIGDDNYTLNIIND